MARRATLRAAARLLGREVAVVLLHVDAEAGRGGARRLIDGFASALLGEAPGGTDLREALRGRLRDYRAAGAGTGILLLDDAERAAISELAELLAETRDPEDGRRLLRVALSAAEPRGIGGSDAAATRWLAACAAAAPEPVDFWMRLPRRLEPIRFAETARARPYSRAREPRGRAAGETTAALTLVGALVGALAGVLGGAAGALWLRGAGPVVSAIAGTG